MHGMKTHNHHCKVDSGVAKVPNPFLIRSSHRISQSTIHLDPKNNQ